MNDKIKIRILNPVMGVPITFLDKMNRENFEIVERYAIRESINGKVLYRRIPIRKKVK